jgi:predicted MarR family transcription regulator
MFAIFESIQRWQAKCVEASEGAISGQENTILNVVRLNDRAKGLSDIAQFLNRTDLSNIQYAIRKLLKQGLIQKTPGKSENQRKDVTYEVTETGYRLTEKFATIRRQLLIEAFKNAGLNEELFIEMRGKVNAMIGIYESASRETSFLNFNEID